MARRRFTIKVTEYPDGWSASAGPESLALTGSGPSPASAVQFLLWYLGALARELPKDQLGPHCQRQLDWMRSVGLARPDCGVCRFIGFHRADCPVGGMAAPGKRKG